MKGILLLAYGTPRSLDEVEEYFTHIRRGRRPSDEEIEELREKYIRIGGTSPLYEITYNQAKALEKLINQKVYVGFKHSRPFIRETIEKMKEDGYKEITAIVLAPHYSKMSVEEYIKYADVDGIDIKFIKSWHLEEMFIETWIDLINEALNKFNKDEIENLFYIFSAHSLPKRILEWNDPYPHQLLETTLEIVKKLNIRNWTLCYQSQSKTGEEWLGPDILDVIEKLSKDGYKSILVCPIGFVCDHLEVLYDIDIECKEKAKELNIHLERTNMPNTHPKFIKALVNLVNKTL
ncbi:MAG: ferrochelatase [candidate division WOR-3 bacterium]|jgi:ferrochelatase